MIIFLILRQNIKPIDSCRRIFSSRNTILRRLLNSLEVALKFLLGTRLPVGLVAHEDGVRAQLPEADVTHEVPRRLLVGGSVGQGVERSDLPADQPLRRLRRHAGADAVGLLLLREIREDSCALCELGKQAVIAEDGTRENLKIAYRVLSKYSSLFSSLARNKGTTSRQKVNRDKHHHQSKITLRQCPATSKDMFLVMELAKCRRGGLADGAPQSTRI